MLTYSKTPKAFEKQQIINISTFKYIEGDEINILLKPLYKNGSTMAVLFRRVKNE